MLWDSNEEVPGLPGTRPCKTLFNVVFVRGSHKGLQHSSKRNCRNVAILLCLRLLCLSTHSESHQDAPLKQSQSIKRRFASEIEVAPTHSKPS